MSVVTSELVDDKLLGIREEFPALERQVYLNTGSTGPLPRRSAAAITRQVEHELVQGRANFAAIVRQYAPLREELRARFARLLGAEADSVALTHHTTEGVNLVAWGINWRSGDEIVTTTHEHEGGLLPIYAVARHRGVTVRFADLDANAGDVTRAIAAAITPRTRLVLVSHVSYRTGMVLPVAEIARIAHRSDAFFAVDGAQAAGTIPVGVESLDVDAYAISGQKWLCGPEGVGALYVRRERISQLAPTFVGHFAMRDVAAIDLSGYFLPAPGARRYDGGTVFWPGLVGMVESLRYLADVVGYDWIFERTRSITARARAVLRDQPGVSVLSPGDNVALTAFAVAGLSPRPIADALAERGIVVRTLAHPPALRISTGFFTGDDDLMRLAEAIEEIRHEG